jgi:diamine N-acetyltransferase
LSTAVVRLREWRVSDVPALRVLRNDDPLQAQLLARARGSDEAAVLRWLETRAASPNSWFRIVADGATDAPLGYLQVVDIEPDDHRGEFGICLAPDAQGKGRGLAALRLALQEAARVHALRKVSLRVRTDNARAIRCYEAAGFERCGLLREHVHIEGAWRDVLLMEHFLPEWTA